MLLCRVPPSPPLAWTQSESKLFAWVAEVFSEGSEVSGKLASLVMSVILRVCHGPIWRAAAGAGVQVRERERERERERDEEQECLISVCSYCDFLFHEV